MKNTKTNWVIKKNQLIINENFKENAFVIDNICNSPWKNNLDQINTILVNEGVTALPAGSFYNCTKVREIKLPNSLKSIGYQCFHNCSALEELVLPDNLSVIADYAFTFCVSLKKLIISTKSPLTVGLNVFETAPNSQNIVKIEYNGNIFDYVNESNIGANGCITQDCAGKTKDCEWVLQDGCLTIKKLSDSAIFVKDNHCSSPWSKWSIGIYSAVVSDGIQSLPPGTFYNCINIKEVELPASLVNVGYQAFHNCRKLETLMIPANVNEIGSYCFTYCTALRTLFFMSSKSPILGINLFEHSGMDKVIVLKGRNWLNSNVFSTETIGIDTKVSYAAYGRNSKLEWNLDNGNLTITAVGKNPQIMPDYVYDNVPSAPWYPYRNGIYSVSIIGNFKCMGAGAFYDCINLENIHLNEEVESIHYQCFHNCRSIKKIHFPKTVRMIGDYAFTYCVNLNTILLLSESNLHMGKLLFEGIPKEHKIQIFAINPGSDFLKDQSFAEQIQIIEIG